MESSDRMYLLTKQMSIPLLKADEKHEMTFSHDKDVKNPVKQAILIYHSKS